MRGLRASTRRSVALHAARGRRRERVAVPCFLILSIKATLASFSPMVHRCVLAVALAFAVGFPVLPQSSNQAAVPFRFSHTFGLILINAEVNGTPALLVLDTGSNHTAISPRFVDVASPYLGNRVSTERGSGYSGTGVFTKVSLKVGPLVWRDHRVLAMDMKEISGTLGENVDGILGVDFLSEFEIFVVDVRHHKLILR